MGKAIIGATFFTGDTNQSLVFQYMFIRNAQKEMLKEILVMYIVHIHDICSACIK